MEFNSISAYSCRVSWGSNARLIECFGNGFNQKATIENGEISTTIVNLEPSKIYTVRITLENDSVLTSDFKTCSYEEPCLENLYESLLKNEEYDTTLLNKKIHDIFVQNFSTIVKTGDQILANVSVDGTNKQLKTVAVRDGEKINVSEESVFLPFSPENQNFMQSATIVGEKNEEAVLFYDREEDAFGYGGEMFKVGDKFEMFGRSVLIGYGSIVLIFSDTVVKDWNTLGYTDAKAALVAAGDAGSSFTSTMTAANMNLIAERTDALGGSTYQSAWVSNSETPGVSEISRIVTSVDDANINATISIGVLHEDLASNRFIEPTIQSAYDYTSISSQDGADATRSAVFRSTGLQFDNDDSAIYFGASQEFRIKFSSGTPDVLSFEYFDSSAGDYVVKNQISSGSS